MSQLDSIVAVCSSQVVEAITTQTSLLQQVFQVMGNHSQDIHLCLAIFEYENQSINFYSDGISETGNSSESFMRPLQAPIMRLRVDLLLQSYYSRCNYEYCNVQLICTHAIFNKYGTNLYLLMECEYLGDKSDQRGIRRKLLCVSLGIASIDKNPLIQFDMFSVCS